jgi:tRNA-uridine 2-sulfurtransferase
VSTAAAACGPGPAPRPGDRVVVGLSGGVDSSVAAAILVEQGFEVVGITMHLAGSESRCCSLDDAEDARRVATQLGIRFHVANYRERFRAEVIEPFADAYLAGRTPIPCVTCNQRFKFHHLLARARVLGARAVATGHYARVARDPDSGALRLRRGRDRAKDQSYFLFNLSAAQLEGVLFPLGELTKAEVRARARSLGLATAEKAESQEICFVPDGDYARVVEALRPGRLPGEGEVVDDAGRVLGRHGGVHRFTVGQRRGLGLGGGERRYVRALDPGRNRVIVGGAASLATPSATLAGVHWVDGPPPEPLRARVQIRYRHAGAGARVEPLAEGRAHVRFDAPERAVAPGQAAVFYRGEDVLGGGWIADASG